MRLFGEQFTAGVLRDAITAIVGGISAGTNILGGIFRGNAAKDAATIQVNAANAAGTELKDTAAQVNPGILASAAAAAGSTNETAARGAEEVSLQGKQARDNAQAAALTANAGLDPYTKAGEGATNTLSAGLAPGGDFNKTPTLSDLQIDPGYKFRLDQGTEALTRSAAAHGGVGGGGFAKDLNNYVQGSASQEYQNAFNRFETSTQNRFSNLDAVSREGQTAATTAGRNLTESAQYGGNIMNNASQFGAGLTTNAQEFGANLNNNAADRAAQNTLDAAAGDANYRTQGANAAAGGKIQSANATWGGFTGAANSALSAVLKRPSNNYFQPGTNPGYNGYPAGTA